MTDRAPAWAAGAARLALGAALCWSAVSASSLSRPELSIERSQELWEQAQVERASASPKKALSSVDRLLGSYPDNPIYLSFAAQLFQDLKDPGREAAAWELFMPVAPFPAEACPRLGQAYRELGQDDKALDAFRRCLEADPGKSDLLFFIGQEQARQGRTAEAASYFERVLKRTPESPDALLGLARLKLAQDDLAAAQALVGRVLSKSPKNADALAESARIAEKRGDYQNAQRMLLTAIAESPSYADLYRMLGRVSLAAGDRAAALKAYSALRELLPEDEEAALRLKRLQDGSKP
jgi:tetratricopeptide (TPR) repeat protein